MIREISLRSLHDSSHFNVALVALSSCSAAPPLVHPMKGSVRGSSRTSLKLLKMKSPEAILSLLGLPMALGDVGGEFRSAW